jgi:excisionase family DNA binding protein
MPIVIERIAFYTISEVAKELNVTEQSVRLWIKSGKLRVPNLGKPVLIPEKNLRAFLKQRIASTSDNITLQK